MKQEYTKKILFLSISIIVLLVIALGSTYAIFTYTKLGTTDNTITTGTLKFLYTENSTGGTGINISEAEPISDTQGKELVGDKNVFDFKVTGTNTSNSDLPYGITLKKKSDSTLVDEGVKVYLTEVAGNSETGLIGPTLYSELTQSAQSNDSEKVVYVNKVAANTKSYEKSFRLRIWLDENLDFSSGNYNNKTFTATVNVYSNDKVKEEKLVYKESILNGTDPVLKNNLVPIKIASNGTVTKADISNKWYSYQDKEWANAVILKDEAKTYSSEEVIPEDNIESYFVWIPRYKYQIFDEGNYSSLTSIEDKTQTINVVFENKDTTPSNGGGGLKVVG